MCVLKLVNVADAWEMLLIDELVGFQLAHPFEHTLVRYINFH